MAGFLERAVRSICQCAWLVAGSMALAIPADAAAEQWIGRPIADVRVQTVAGAPVDAAYPVVISSVT